MKAIAKAQSVRISPRKVSPVAVLIQGKSANDAQNILKFTPKRAAGIIGKALNSAMANAVNNHGLKQSDLVVEKVLVGPATTLKRYRPKARGSAYPLLKYSSHITVVLTDEGTGAGDLELGKEKSQAPKPKAPIPKKEAK